MRHVNVRARRFPYKASMSGNSVMVRSYTTIGDDDIVLIKL